MKTSRDFSLAAGAFFLVFVGLAMNVQPTWWSILGVVLVAVAVMTLTTRAAVLRRAERSAADR
jgi:membrane protein implicated in regulation of membrane protease activity